MSPPRCAACGAALAARAVFCVTCAATVERCEEPEGPVAFGLYGGALARAIQRFKYEASPHLALPLGALLRDACRRSGVRADVVVPVPLHRGRLIDRGYNQSALLAHHVGREVGARLETRALARVVDTAPQVALPRAARRQNVEGAFTAGAARLVADRTVVLVDDVFTTGATLEACRQVLLGAGARRVTTVVLARTLRSEPETAPGEARDFV